MATSQAALATTAAAVGGGMASTTTETIVGWHMFKIDGFSATKNLGVGKSIKSGTFRVGGYDWYIECYPCGDVEESAGWVSLFLCRQDNDDHPTAYTNWEFTLMESLKDGCFKELVGHPGKWVTVEDGDRHSPSGTGTDFIEREKLESLLKDDCFQVRCLVLMEKFPAWALPNLATETISGSLTMTVEGYTKTSRALAVDEFIGTSSSCIGGHNWFIQFYPFGEDENDADGVTAYLYLEDPNENEVKVRFEMTLLTLAGKRISSIQDFYTFSDRNKKYLCNFLSRMEHESSSLLQDGIQIRCDIAVVKGIREVQPPPNLGTDVTFEVGGDLFSAHKWVLATRSTAFMAEFFGPGKDNAGVGQVLRIHDMEPRVFKALLHFIYTDTLPEVREEDKVLMAQGLLVAADRYAMERLKLICGDMLCSCIDATTAVSTMELADKYGCVKLKEACIKVIRDWLAKINP